MSDVLKINNDLYVSASRGAELSGYTSDYIGQLAREGRVASEKIGRTLYVHQYELLRYANKKEAHTTSKRGPKKETDKKKAPSVSIPTKEDSARAVPLKYGIEGDKKVLKTTKKASTKPYKERTQKITILKENKETRSQKPQKKKISRRKGRKQRSLEEFVGKRKKVTKRVERGRRNHLRVANKVLLTLLILASLSGIFIENTTVYTQESGIFSKETHYFALQMETFLRGMGEIADVVKNLY